MQEKVFRIIALAFSIVSTLLVAGFEIWYIIALLKNDDVSSLSFILSMFGPAFLILFSIVILAAQFNLKFLVEQFKFLKWMPGISFFQLFMAAMMAMQFAIINSILAIVFCLLFIILSIAFFVLHFFRPIEVQEELAES